MTCVTSSIRPRIALLAALALAACTASPGGEVVRVPAYAPGSVASKLSRAARVIVAVGAFAEPSAVAPPPIASGLFAATDNSREFAVVPSPGALLHQAITAELRAAGEQIGGEAAPVQVTGAVQRFTVTASRASLYWAIEVNIAATITVRRARRTLSHSYGARCQDVVYTPPGPDSMAPRVAQCIADIARQFRDDADMAWAIGARAIVG